MANIYICDECGKIEPATTFIDGNTWEKPSCWHQLPDVVGYLDACSIDCREKLKTKGNKNNEY